MKRARLKMGLSGMGVPALAIRCSAIRNAINNNPLVFANPDPSLADISTAIGLLAARQEAVDNIGGKDNTILRNGAKEALLDLMRSLALYVSAVANGNEEIILLSGFQIVDDRNPIGILPAPSGLKVAADGLNLGELQASWKGVNDSMGYMVELTKVIDGNLTEPRIEKAKRLKHKFSSLISGQLYAIRLATLSSAGQGAWSSPVFHRPQ